MKLSELEATFVGRFVKGWVNGGNKIGESHRELESVDGAQGVQFVCPKCGNHSILCWFKNPRNASPVPNDTYPGPGRWTFTGDTIDTLTLDPSVDLSKVTPENPAGPDRCYWHGSVKNGDAS